MRSLINSDSVTGLVVSALCVAAACWVLQVLDRHAKEHGHHGARAERSVERAHRDEGRLDREGQDGGGGHGFIFARGSLSTPLNSVAR